MTEFSISCCPEAGTLFQASCPPGLDEKKWRSAWKATATGGLDGGPQYKRINCGHCGGHLQIVDDGVSVDEGGSITSKDVSMPRIDSLSISGGSRTGGTTTIIHGSSLDVGDLVVHVGSGEAQVTNRSSTEATISTPPGNYSLNVAEGSMVELVFESVTGSFTPNESFTVAGSVASGMVRVVNGTTLTVSINAIVVKLSELSGILVVGGSSGAYGNVLTAQMILFQAGEQITGLASGARGVLLDGPTFVIDQPTGGFAPNELVVGTASGATAKLAASPAYSGAVDVTVENEYGRRDSGGKLVLGYTYA